MMKRILGFGLMILLIGGMTLPVRAESFTGSDTDWHVEFTNDNKMVSNFKTSDLDESISDLQPGDDVIFVVKLQNNNDTTTDWWMTNEVLESLEDNSANHKTGGGAYGYVLLYTDKTGQVTTLYNSDTIGGDEEYLVGVDEGLHAATDALKKYFYLDTLATGESGTVTLTVSLDGETQGNDYQDTLANLQMNFAVELSPDDSRSRSFTGTDSDIIARRLVNGDDDSDSAIRLRDIVRTEDRTNLTPYFIAMAVSGGFILILAIFSLKKSKNEKKEAE